MPNQASGFKLAIVDTETTGLDVRLGHSIWELAVLLRQDGKAPLDRVWQLDVDISRADPQALRMNRFYERYIPPTNLSPGASAAHNRDVAAEVAKLLDGAWLMAAVPSFDAAMLEAFLRANGQAPAWHHRLVCVETWAAARLGVRPPWDPKVLSEMLGIERPPAEHHTAAGDVRWAAKLYDAANAYGTAPITAPAPPAAVEPAAADADAAAQVSDADVEPVDEPEPADDYPTLKERPSTTAASPCSKCEKPVPPEDAHFSFARFQQVLCREPNGGCFATYVPQKASV